jgi:L-ascorbate oxidase
MSNQKNISNLNIKEFNLKLFILRYYAYDYGTHWWHSHMNLQRGDGVFGALVVRQYEKDNAHKELYDFDVSQHIIVINDWINGTSVENFRISFNLATGLLINGRGQGKVFVNESENATIKTPRSTFYVKKNFRYRFRLLNLNFLNCPVEFSIDNHNITLISSDGKSVEPVEVDSFISYPG